MSDDQSGAQIIVDRGECEANAVCEGILPEVFHVNDDDELEILNEFPPADLLDKVQEAVDMCPTRALFLTRAAQ